MTVKNFFVNACDIAVTEAYSLFRTIYCQGLKKGL
jgi:hypothetical protein